MECLFAEHKVTLGKCKKVKRTLCDGSIIVYNSLLDAKRDNPNTDVGKWTRNRVTNRKGEKWEYIISEVGNGLE